MSKNIKVVKLVTGEEIVADIGTGDDANFLLLKHPVKFVAIPMNNGQMGLEMHPYVMLSKDEEFVISSENVLVTGDPVPDVIDAYNRQFSEIALPPEKSLIT